MFYFLLVYKHSFSLFNLTPHASRIYFVVIIYYSKPLGKNAFQSLVLIEEILPVTKDHLFAKKNQYPIWPQIHMFITSF